MTIVYFKTILLSVLWYLSPANGVSLTASYTNGRVIRIQFLEYNFRSFFKCLCNAETSSCIAGYVLSSTDHYVTYITKTDGSASQMPSDIFECIINILDYHYGNIICSKQQKSNDKDKYQHFYNSNAAQTDSCDLTCVGITGTSDYSLQMHNDSRIVNCESDISDITATDATTPTTFRPPTVEIIATEANSSTSIRPQTVEITDAATTSTVKKDTVEIIPQSNTKVFAQSTIVGSIRTTDRYHHTVETTTNRTVPFTQEDKSSNNDEIVIGLVVTLSIVIIFIALGFFLWRKKKLKRKSNESNYQASNIVMSSDAIAMGTPVNTIDSHGEKTQQNAQVSNPYVFFEEDSEFSSNEDEESLPPNSNEYRNVQPMSSDTYSNINDDRPNVTPVPMSPYSEVAESSDVENAIDTVQADSNYELIDNNESSTSDNCNDITTNMSSPYSLAASNTATGYTMNDKDTSSTKPTTPNVTDVYSKLHDKVKFTKNPYDALLDSEDRPNPRQDASLPDVVESSRPANEMVEYTLAHPVNFVSTNEYAGIYYDVEPHGSGPDSSKSNENNSENTTGQSSDVSCVANDDSRTNPYFELERAEDTDECDT